MIRVDSLTRTYGDFTAIDQVSFEIGQGEIVGLLGHNGAGKTTIMQMLTGYLEPSGGRIEIDGLDLATARQQIQQRIGYLPENDPLYPEMTVIDYLDFAAALHGIDQEVRQQQILTAMNKTELTPKATATIATLSRGYRQRVGVAQAILHNPRFLILDEPTNGLDPTQVQHMRELIRSLADEATVIISTHILQEVQALCDRVLIIRHGSMALDASMAELRAGKRIVVEVGGDSERAATLLRAVEGVSSVTSLNAINSDHPTHRFALDLDQEEELFVSAPRVARQL
ncbi:MAG: ABC transporter ATP-binding protein, partial [Gammaproteobacteria bacterium]|nr:ABC transporter ATP-binding protein [Gammaproteobacteria bacterium]